MSLKKAAEEIFKNWATPEEMQEFGKKLVADLQELGFRDRTIEKLPTDSSVPDELVKLGEDNIYHLAPGFLGTGLIVSGTGYKIPGGSKLPPRLVHIGLHATHTTAIYIAPVGSTYPGQSFEWKDREKAERAIVEWLFEYAGKNVRAQLGWINAKNSFSKPSP